MDGQHGLWERIAPSFDRTRTRPWPHVEAFLRALPAGCRVLDLMAGNGRHLPAALEGGREAWWLDWSRPAARIAHARHPGARCVVADAARLPLRDRSFDAAILVAGLPSIPTAEGRAACLRELRRVLRPGSPAQLTAWSRAAPRFAHLPPDAFDVVVPWRGDGHDEARTYHLYTETTLRQAAEAAGFRLLALARSGENLVATLEA